ETEMIYLLAPPLLISSFVFLLLRFLVYCSYCVVYYLLTPCFSVLPAPVCFMAHQLSYAPWTSKRCPISFPFLLNSEQSAV
ncbi:hypothetical protein DFH11DRAFT_1563665, partial [Phellopilus nigrolimitatus]